MKIRFMHLQTPLFLAGTNYGDKLPGAKGRDLTMELDSWKELGGACAIKITNKQGIYTFMPFANTVSCEPEQKTASPLERNQHPDHQILPIKAQIGGPSDVMTPVPINAQVETPHSKIQGIRKGRPAKYQGEPEGQGEA